MAPKAKEAKPSVAALAKEHGRAVAGGVAATWYPITEVATWEKNPKDHTAEHVAEIAASLARFGWSSPLVANARSGQLVAGHGRLLAAQSRGDALVPVRWVDLDEAEAELLALAENRIQERGGYVEEKLAEILRRRAEKDREGLRVAGFDEKAIAAIIRQDDVRRARNAGEDQGPADTSFHEQLQAMWGTEVGQLWRIHGRVGEHRLIVGDCTEPAVVATLAQDERAECCWTDPPYGVDYVGKQKSALKIQNDAKTPEELGRFIEEALRGVREACVSRSAVYIAHPTKALLVQFWLAAAAAGLQLSQLLVWVKDSMVLGFSDYHLKHEPILLCYTPGDGRAGRGTERWYGDNAQTSVFDIPRPKRSEEHPTMKPVELVAAMLKNSCAPGGLVYDPFLGSGTTMVAAETLGMRAMGCELDPKYAAVILDRMSKMGCSAERVDKAA